MGTPFIALQEPTKLDGWVRGKPHDQQVTDAASTKPAHVPPVFRDAMEVREAVFVQEQGVPLEYELDADDPRSCHWVVYASVNRTTEPERRDPATGAVVAPRRSVTRSQPVGTLRVVPFPHPPHPRDGGRYVDNVLQPEPEPEPEPEQNLAGDDQEGEKKTQEPSAPAEEGRRNSQQQQQQQSSLSGAALPFGPDRATTYHDGREPYVKIGRMAVVSEFRGHRIAGQLWRAARGWLEAHPAAFDPSVAELGMDQLRAAAASEIPQWRGLVVCHAQADVVPLYERWGFRVDEGMGRWSEEGIPHVGMALRLDVKKRNPTI
ncbi:hypothetical protein SLS62_001642 [Diatrype stigma]|uniref:Uncharacterized protein n=1 Tax=Diatrype stigma TaxID=117547 RepID=A0AAN9UYU4_9PEZI